jgi:hypothetical protein
MHHVPVPRVRNYTLPKHRELEMLKKDLHLIPRENDVDVSAQDLVGQYVEGGQYVYAVSVEDVHSQMMFRPFLHGVSKPKPDCISTPFHRNFFEVEVKGKNV